MTRAPRIVRAVPSPHQTQLETTVENLEGGLIERLFLSHQRADPIPTYHNHAGEQFIVALEGESNLEVLRGAGAKAQTATFPIREGDVAVLSALKPHRWITSHGELAALAINLASPDAEVRRGNPNRGEFEDLVALLMGSGEPEHLRGLVKGDAAFKRLVEEYQAEARLRRAGMKFRIGALCAEMLVHMARARAGIVPGGAGARASASSRPAARSLAEKTLRSEEPLPIGGSPAAQLAPRLSPLHYVDRAREYLHTDYRRAIALPELAERVGLSVTHLHRLFVGQLKVPPMAYLRQYRLKRAGELLAATARPVREIAREVGFPEPERFTKAFHRAFGCSPRDYRKAALKTEPAPL